MDDLSQNTAWVDHTHKVIAAAEQIVALAVDIETGMRGYLLAGEREFLEPLEHGRARFFDAVIQLQQTVADNPPQVKRLEEVRSTIEEWLTKVVDPALALRQKVNDGQESMQEIDSYVSRMAGKTLFDKFRKTIGEFEDIERDLISERQVAVENIRSKIDEEMKVLVEGRKSVDHTHKVIAEAKKILLAAVDMETGMRGYPSHRPK